MDDPGEGMPMVDLFSAYWEQDESRADPAVRFDEQQMPMRLALMFTPLDEALPRNHLGGTDFSWTYFGGRPSQAPGTELPWPRPRAGDPLSHVMQVDLYAQWLDHGTERLEPIGLPMTGLLQFFHDLETYGDEEDDHDAWSVRWLPRGDEDDHRKWTSATVPADLDPESQRPPDVHALQLGEDDRFHGGRHLEVWMRRSDLTAQRFDRVWCLIRTDH